MENQISSSSSEKKGLTGQKEAPLSLMTAEQSSSATTTPAMLSSTPPLQQQALGHSHSLPVNIPSQQQQQQQWNPYLHNNSNISSHNQYPPYQEVVAEENSFSRATTLVGVGGLLGWTAAAAYRWLNGGEFSMFPPPPSTTTLTAIGTNNTAATIHGEAASSRHDADAGQNRPVGHSYHASSSSTHWNGNHNHTVQESARSDATEKLAEQVQRLIAALQKQSEEHRELVKRLSQQNDTRKTNESMQRLLREQQQQQKIENVNSNATVAETAATMAVFCKLAEIQVELASIQRTVKDSPVDTEKWDDRLDATLEQIQSCLSKLNPENKDSSASIFDATPTRPKMPWMHESTTSEGVNNKTENLDETEGPPTTTNTNAVADAFRQLVLENDPTQLRVGAQLLYLYAINLANHSKIPRYRKIFTSNESFQKVNTLKGGRELLRALGFEDADNWLEWKPGNEEEEAYYLSQLNEVSVALGILKSPRGQTSPGDLLEQTLSCLSSLSVTSTPAPTRKAPAGEEESSLPLLYKTPDPSITSPPATKKQSVNFSPSTLVVESSASSLADSSFFADKDNDSAAAPMETLVDADNVWK